MRETTDNLYSRLMVKVAAADANEDQRQQLFTALGVMSLEELAKGPDGVLDTIRLILGEHWGPSKAMDRVRERLKLADTLERLGQAP